METKNRNRKERFDDYLNINLQDTYSSAVIVAALYKKIFGEFPKIGLSGEQADCAGIVLVKIDKLEAYNKKKKVI